MESVERAVADGVGRGRRLTQAKAREALEAEWSQVQATVAKAGGRAPAAPRTQPRPTARHLIAAKSYASAWGAAALATDIDSATTATEPRLERIIVTETSDAFQEERVAFERAVVRENEDAKWFPYLIKVWDRRLERGTCPRCVSRSLSIRPWGIAFSGGDEPGRIHPNCRCTTVSIMLPVPAGIFTST